MMKIPGLVASVLAVSAFGASTGHTAGSSQIGTLSIDALRKCADAQVAECQFRLGQALERGEGISRDLALAKRQYELAYQAGFEDAGTALLRITRQMEPSIPAPAGATRPAGTVQAHQSSGSAAPGIGAGTASATATPVTATPVTATKRNPGDLVGVPNLAPSEYLQYKQCWKFVFTKAFRPSPKRAYVPTNFNRITREVKESLFNDIDSPEVRVVCLNPKGGTAALIEGGKAISLRYSVDEKRNSRFYEEYQTSPTLTTTLDLQVKENGRDGEMFIAVFPIGKDARVSRNEPTSVSWLRGEVTAFSP